jgi:hypothetical protein
MANLSGLPVGSRANPGGAPDFLSFDMGRINERNRSEIALRNAMADADEVEENLQQEIARQNEWREKWRVFSTYLVAENEKLTALANKNHQAATHNAELANSYAAKLTSAQAENERLTALANKNYQVANSYEAKLASAQAENAQLKELVAQQKRELSYLAGVLESHQNVVDATGAYGVAFMNELKSASPESKSHALEQGLNTYLKACDARGFDWAARSPADSLNMKGIVPEFYNRLRGFIQQTAGEQGKNPAEALTHRFDKQSA